MLWLLTVMLSDKKSYGKSPHNKKFQMVSQRVCQTEKLFCSLRTNVNNITDIAVQQPIYISYFLISS